MIHYQVCWSVLVS